MNDFPPAHITLAAPHYGPAEDNFPGTLFTTFDGTLRVILDSDTTGEPLWRVQRRASNTTSHTVWGNLFAAAARDALCQCLASYGITDPALADYVQNSLPNRATRT